MKMSSKHLLLILLALPITALAQTQSQPGNKPVTAPRPPQHKVNEGERIFQQNCSRCHTVPDGFSPHISGTIVRHMRMRASLSKHDEEQLLRFFNP
jgi:mono/diheme cytochrome c family protein